MKRKIFGLLVLGFVFLPLLAVQAQTTQGQITVTGLLPSAPPPPAPACLPPAPATADLTFFIIDAGSTVLYGPDNQPAVPVDADCRFFASVGAGTGGDVPASILQVNTSLFIRFDDTATGEILGLLPINSSGYAHFALGVPDNAVTTTNIQDSAVTSAKIAAGSVDSSKIVDGSIGASHVDSTQVQRRVIESCDVGNAIRVINDAGTVICEPTGGGGIGGSGTANSVPKFTGTTTIGNSAITEVGGNVGIGTTTPAGRLAVRGNGTDVLLGDAGCGPPTAAIGFGTMSGCTDFALGGNFSAGADAGTFINRPTGRGIHFRENNGADQMTIAPGGNVGIGTTTPGQKLEVRDTGGGAAVFGISNGVGVVGITDHIARPGVRAVSAGGGSPANLGLEVFGRAFISGRVGIGTGAPDQLLSVNGNASKVGGGTWLNFSDERLKAIHGMFDAGLEEILKLRPIRYRYNQDNPVGIPDEGEHIGLSAQEVQKVIPEAVTKNSQGYLMLNNDPVLWAMLNAIKEQQAQIKELKAEVEGLKAKQTEGRKIAMSPSPLDGEASPAGTR